MTDKIRDMILNPLTLTIILILPYDSDPDPSGI